MANSGETARLLFGLLKEVNGVRLHPAERFRFLERLREPVSHLSGALERHYMGKPFPLAARDRKVAELGREFQVLMAQGYKILLQDLGRRSALSLVLQRKIFATSIHRAICYLSRTLLRSYQLYAPYPEDVWREIHQLYRLAVRFRFQDRPLVDEENKLERATNIATAYKQILLLALSSPYRLRQGDVARVYTALERWASYCRLNRIDTQQQSWQGLFGVPSDIDDQPKYLELKDGQTGRLEWVLDTAALRGVLRRQLRILASEPQDDASLRAGKVPPDISPQLLRRVMQSWGMMVKREHSRVDKEGEDAVEVVLGLSAIHHFIDGETSESQPSDEHGFDEGEEETEISGEVPLPWTVGILRNVEHKILRCAVKDVGPGGYRLRWPVDSPLKAQVGALLGIRSGELADEKWGIGVIRWMRAMEVNRLEVGIQMLAPAVEAVSMRACNVHGMCGERLVSLLLPPVPPTQGAETIIGPVFLNNFGAAILLRKGIEQMVKLTRVVENTGSFAQFEFKLAADEKEGEGELKRRQEDKDEGFDSLWSSI